MRLSDTMILVAAMIVVGAPALAQTGPTIDPVTPWQVPGCPPRCKGDESYVPGKGDEVQAQPPPPLFNEHELPKEGKIYVFHSKPAGQCPALDWHVVVGEDNKRSGMVAWNNMKSMAKVTGQIAQDWTFTMNGRRATGRQEGAVLITGKLRADGWLSANIEGPNIKCQGIAVPWVELPPPPRPPDWGKP
jgi:hypothetical protein